MLYRSIKILYAFRKRLSVQEITVQVHTFSGRVQQSFVLFPPIAFREEEQKERKRMASFETKTIKVQSAFFPVRASSDIMLRLRHWNPFFHEKHLLQGAVMCLKGVSPYRNVTQ